jgi:hypothetical protein
MTGIPTSARFCARRSSLEQRPQRRVEPEEPIVEEVGRLIGDRDDVGERPLDLTDLRGRHLFSSARIRPAVRGLRSARRRLYRRSGC